MSIATEIKRLQNAKADIKTAIEEKGVEVGNGTIDTYAEKIGEISVGGLGLEQYTNTFRLTTLNAFEKSEAVLNLDNVISLELLCAIRDPSKDVCKQLMNKTVEHLTINTPKLVNSCDNMLSLSNYAVDNKMKRLTLNVDTQNSKSFALMFNNLRVLEVIDGTPIDITNTVNNNGMFQATNSLVEVRFKGEIKRTLSFSYSPNLSDATIQNIIDTLADLTGQTTQTLTFHATVGAKLTDTQKAIITAKNWTLAY